MIKVKYDLGKEKYDIAIKGKPEVAMSEMLIIIFDIFIKEVEKQNKEMAQMLTQRIYDLSKKRLQ